MNILLQPCEGDLNVPKFQFCGFQLFFIEGKIREYFAGFQFTNLIRSRQSDEEKGVSQIFELFNLTVSHP